MDLSLLKLDRAQFRDQRWLRGFGVARDGQTRFDVESTCSAARPENAITSGQWLANSFPNTGYQQDPTRATGTRTRESRHLRYAVNRRVAGLNPA